MARQCHIGIANDFLSRQTSNCSGVIEKRRPFCHPSGNELLTELYWLYQGISRAGRQPEQEIQT
jgi:hypothetical protein